MPAAAFSGGVFLALFAALALDRSPLEFLFRVGEGEPDSSLSEENASHFAEYEIAPCLLGVDVKGALRSCTFDALLADDSGGLAEEVTAVSKRSMNDDDDDDVGVIFFMLIVNRERIFLRPPASQIDQYYSSRQWLKSAKTKSKELYWQL